MKYIFLFLALTFVACSSDDNEDASDECKAYCSNLDTNCTGANAVFPSTDSCFNSCALFTDRPDIVKAQTGDSVQCRVYHSNVATANPAVHCSHASVKSTPDTCQDIQTVCSTYCGEFFETCEEEFNADFGKSLQSCLNKCPVKIPKDGMSGATIENTVNCRLSQINIKNCDGGKIESEICVDPVE